MSENKYPRMSDSYELSEHRSHPHHLYVEEAFYDGRGCAWRYLRCGSRKGKVLWVGIALLIVCAALGIGLGFGFSGKTSAQKDELRSNKSCLDGHTTEPPTILSPKAPSTMELTTPTSVPSASVSSSNEPYTDITRDLTNTPSHESNSTIPGRISPMTTAVTNTTQADVTNGTAQASYSVGFSTTRPVATTDSFELGNASTPSNTSDAQTSPVPSVSLTSASKDIPSSALTSHVTTAMSETTPVPGVESTTTTETTSATTISPTTEPATTVASTTQPQTTTASTTKQPTTVAQTTQPQTTTASTTQPQATTASTTQPQATTASTTQPQTTTASTTQPPTTTASTTQPQTTTASTTQPQTTTASTTQPPTTVA